MRTHAKEYDIVIIGSGPSGCSAAYYANKSLNVLLCYDALNSREKPCGGLIIDKSQHFIKNMGSVADEIFSYPPILGAKYIDWNTNQEKIEKVKLWNVWRNKLDRWLLERCRCEVWNGVHFLNYAEENGYVKITLRRENRNVIIKAKFLVGADGAKSIIRNKLYPNLRIEKYVAFQEWVKCNKDLNDMVYFIYDNRISDLPLWVIPKSEYILVGAAFKNFSVKKISIFRSFLLKRLNIKGITLKKQFHPICRPRSVGEILFGRGHVMLVGEAAGLINPGSGEGISFALRSGFNCAEALNINWYNPLFQYAVLCNPLLKEIEEGLRWAEIISNPRKRLDEFFRNK